MKMKKLYSVFLGLALAAMCQFSLAAPAVVTELVGTAQRIPDGAAPIALKNGDAINERDTVQTGENSGVVLRFEDGQRATIGASSRMTVNAYTYDLKDPAKSNVLLSLLTGSMRAITGLIGKSRPDKVAFRAGTATIGIRGTDVTFATTGGDVVVSVNDGVISFTFGGRTVEVQRGQAVLTQNGQLTQGTIEAIKKAVEQNPGLNKALESVNTSALQNATQQAAAASLQPVTTQNPAQPTCGASCN
jgi:hypothetical protein